MDLPLSKGGSEDNEHLVRSDDAEHPANLIPTLCAKFWKLGWVTGTGGGASIRNDDLVYIAPSGVQKELMKPSDMYVLSLAAQARTLDQRQRVYLRSPAGLKPSQCCCIHTHSQWAVLVTLILESYGPGLDGEFRINNMEQIKGFGRGFDRPGNLGYHDTLRIPVIENTAHEEDLTDFLEDAMEKYTDTYAVLVRRHGVYVWGETVHKAKTQCESLDYLFQLAVEMKKLNMPWVSHITPTTPMTGTTRGNAD